MQEMKQVIFVLLVYFPLHGMTVPSICECRRPLNYKALTKSRVSEMSNWQDLLHIPAINLLHFNCEWQYCTMGLVGSCTPGIYIII